MEDPNLIARLYPFHSSPHAISAINHLDNSSLHIPALHREDLAPSRQIRESTPEREESNEIFPVYLYQRGLQLTFNNMPKGDKGICLGRDRSKCDIFLPDLRKEDPISGRHCYFTFDDQYRLILRDESSHGTTVLYDGDGGEQRCSFTWILGGHSVPDEIEEIVVRFHPLLQFQVVISKAQTDPSQYTANVEQFRKEMTASAEPYIGELGLQSPNTTAPLSEAQTPRRGPILLERGTLGSGAFGVVIHHWDVSTGVEYACKRPRDTLSEEEQKLWKKEIRLMRRIKHENIVKFYPAVESLVPCLYLDYLPHGNLEKQHRQNPISYEETLIILRQCLSALKYLHEQDPPIAHRDLKPENILVRDRDPLHVQLADFGLAKEVKVDIWSLGVVALRLTHKLPVRDCRGIIWCKRIIDKANKYKNEDLIDFLTTHMLVLKPEIRSSAEVCSKAVEELCVRFEDGSRTPTEASSAERVLPTGQSISPDNAISGFSSSKIDAYIKTDACLPESRKRLPRPRSSSDTKKVSKRPAQKAGHSNHRQREQKCSGFRLFNSNWLQDSKCVGSSVADMGRDDPSCWNSGSNPNSAITSASGEGHVPRSAPSNVDETAQ